MPTDDSTKFYVSQKLEEQKKQSDELYAIKLVERIVFGAVGILAITVFGALIALVIQNKP